MVDESSRSVLEQIHLYRDAKVIAGAHGSAFTNMIWAAPGAKIVEMVPSTFDVPYHNRLSQGCGHTYTKIPCPNGPTAQTGVSIHFNANPGDVLDVIDRVLAETP
jgi:capsular polysaccharide biosynthesis protein